MRDPLLHFLLAGLLLFVGYDQFASQREAADAGYLSGRIIVDEATLVRFIEYRSKNFDENLALERLHSAPPEQLNELIDEYVQEEAQYRTALKYGLDQDDYVIRRRLVQKMDFMAEGVGSSSVPPDAQTLAPFFVQHAQRYAQPARVTFTHVFFSNKSRTAEALAVIARDTLHVLNSQQIAFADAPQFGERFPYQLNYVERPHDEVAAHFGATAAEALFALTADLSRWVGPIDSAHGVHLVLVSESQPGYAPELDEVLDQVRADYLAQRAGELRTTFADELTAQFEIAIDPALLVRQ